MTSRRVVWTQRGTAKVETCETPSPTDDQLLLRTRVSLISPGTERAFFLGMPNTSQRYPQYPGYLNIGEVVQVGGEVRGWKVGQRVASTGNHAMHIVVKASECLPVPENLPDEEAVFFNLVAIALQGVRKARIELGESVVVIGAGLVGLLAMQLAKLDGALPVISVDLDERRLAFARDAGADAALMVDDNLTSAISSLSEGEGAPVVIEATGSPEPVLLAFALAGMRGRVVLLGSTRNETKSVNFYRDVHKKGLTIIGAHTAVRPKHDSSAGWWTSHDDQRVALKLLAMGRLSVQPLITHRFPWQQAPQAYNLLKEGEKDAIGIVLDWHDGG